MFQRAVRVAVVRWEVFAVVVAFLLCAFISSSLQAAAFSGPLPWQGVGAGKANRTAGRGERTQQLSI